MYLGNNSQDKDHKVASKVRVVQEVRQPDNLEVSKDPLVANREV